MLARPDPNSFELLPWVDPTAPAARMFCDIAQPRRLAVRGRSPPGAASATSTGPGSGASRSTSRPRWSSSTSHGRRSLQAAQGAGQRVVLRPHHGRRGGRPAQAHRPDARDDGHPRRVLVPRGQPEPARDRPAPHRRPDHGRQRDDVPAGRARGSRMRRACTPRSCPSHSKACRARACTPTCRSSRATRTRSTTAAIRYKLSKIGSGLHRRAPRATRARSPPITNQTVNSYKRLIPGFEAPVYVAWARNNRSALVRVPITKSGKAASTRIEYRAPDPAVQPLPRVLGDAGCRLEGHRGGIRAADARPRRTSSSSPTRNGPPKASSSCHSRCPRRSTRWRGQSSLPKRWASTSSSGSCATSVRSGSDTRPR